MHKISRGVTSLLVLGLVTLGPTSVTAATVSWSVDPSGPIVPGEEITTVLSLTDVADLPALEALDLAFGWTPGDLRITSHAFGPDAAGSFPTIFSPITGTPPPDLPPGRTTAGTFFFAPGTITEGMVVFEMTFHVQPTVTAGEVRVNLEKFLINGEVNEGGISLVAEDGSSDLVLTAVPVPAAGVLFLSALLGLVGIRGATWRRSV